MFEMPNYRLSTMVNILCNSPLANKDNSEKDILKAVTSVMPTLADGRNAVLDAKKLFLCISKFCDLVQSYFKIASLKLTNTSSNFFNSNVFYSNLPRITETNE